MPVWTCCLPSLDSSVRFCRRDRSSELGGLLSSGRQNLWVGEAVLTPDVGKRDPCFGYWALGNFAQALLGPRPSPWGCAHPELLRLLSGACSSRTSAQRIVSRPPGLATTCPQAGAAGGVAKQCLFGAAGAGAQMSSGGGAAPLWEGPCSGWVELGVGGAGERAGG